MTTTTTTTFAAVQAAFVTAAADAVPTGVTVSRLWPGPDATSKMVFLTDVDWVSVEDALITPARRKRNESYNASFEIWNLSKDSIRERGSQIIDDTKLIYDACEGVVVQADSPVRAVAGVVNAVCEPTRLEVVTFEAGWGAVLTAQLSVTARLD